MFRPNRSSEVTVSCARAVAEFGAKRICSFGPWNGPDTPCLDRPNAEPGTGERSPKEAASRDRLRENHRVAEPCAVLDIFGERCAIAGKLSCCP